MMKMVLGAFAALFCGAAMAEPITAAIGAVTSVLGAMSPGVAALTGGLGSMAANKLMAKKPGGTTTTAQPVMPTTDDEAVRRAKQRQVAEIQARSGRASTILSDGGKLGG